MADETERLSDGELGYHRHLLEQGDRLPVLQQQRQQIDAEIARIVAGQQSYQEFLVGAHDLKEGDRVREDGTIARRFSSIDAMQPSAPVPQEPAPEHPAETWRREHPDEAREG